MTARLALWSLLASAASAQSIDAIAAEALRLSKTPGLAIAVVRGGEVVHLKGYGFRDADKPVTPDTIFAIGSLTKAFTTTAMAILADEGKLDWDDPVRKHLPYFRLADPLADANVTLRDLVTHRTGLAGHDLLWQYAPWTLEESIRRIGEVPLSRPFRTAYQYQNIMYNAAGYAAAAAAGQPWHEFVQRRIFNPLGMKNAVFTSSAAKAAADHAVPHRDGAPIAWYEDNEQIRPAGSIKTSVRDLTGWMKLHLNGGEIVSSRNLEETHTPWIVRPRSGDELFSEYGMGWVIGEHRGRRMLSHGGAVIGFRAHLALLPKEKIGVVALTNADLAWVQTSTVLTVLDLLLDAPPRNWHAEFESAASGAESRLRSGRLAREAKRHKDTKPSRELAAYAGEYRAPGYGLAAVSVDRGGLVLGWSRFRTALKHFHFDTFDVTGDARLDGEQVVFSLDASGEVSTLRFLNVDFKRSRQALNHAAMASKIVDTLKLTKGERVLARFDPSTFRELIPLLAERIRARGARWLAPVSIEQPLPPLDSVDVYLYLPLRPAKRDLPAEERKALAAWLDRGGSRRQIHFHWADGSRAPDGLPGEHTTALDASYQDALGIDHAVLSAAQDRAIRLLRSGSVRIYTPAGTDFFFRVGQRPFNKQDGDASAERMKSARVRVDREIELPAGVLRVAPVEETAAGVIVIPEARFGGAVAKKIALYFDNGRISRVRAEQGQASVEEALKAGGDAAYWFREFGLGFNPKLTGTSYYGYGAGVVRLSLGDNEELGGKVRGGFYRWLLFPDATVEVDGTYLVRNGKLIVP